ncbi:MAG: DUF4175 domain-containing protein, partial [Alphaproteobacteria bacterium]|nr:DUF4175 domain-containing protein [Alphaproteobacteria bacterium]
GTVSTGQSRDSTAPPPIPAPIIPAKVDAWVTPPQYTSQAPIFLTNESVVRAETPVGSELVAPVGSRMTIRVVGGDSTVTVTGDAIIEREPPPLPTAEEAAATQTTRPVPARPIIREYEIVMQDDATVHIEAHGGVVMSWRFDITGDRAPQATVQASENPERPGTVDLEYRVDDDYGAISVQTEIQDGEAPRSQSTRPPRPLVTPPQINLPVPR